MDKPFNLFDTVILVQDDEYHLLGNIVALPGFKEEYSVYPVPYYSVNFSCSDGQIENLWLSADEMKIAPPVIPYQATRLREGN